MTSKKETDFETLLLRVNDELCRFGFLRSGNALIEQDVGCVRIIEFQISEEAEPDQIKFTINLGFISKELLELTGELRSYEAHSAHLFKRIGFLLPHPEDTWWILSDSIDVDVLAAELIGVLSLAALPFLKKLGGHDSFRTYLWGLVRLGQAMYDDVIHLCQLEARFGNKDNFENSIKELRSTGLEVGFSADEIENTENAIRQIRAETEPKR